MRLLDQEPMDPNIAEELAAIDATLAGEPVEPRHAELAELALLLRAERPQIDEGFARRLDARVERRFAVATAPKPAGRKRFFSRTWVWAPTASAAALAASVAVVLLIGSGGGPGVYSGAGAICSTCSTPASATAAAGTSATRSPETLVAPTRAPSTAALPAAQNQNFAPAVPGQAAAPGGLTPPSSNRKIVQSSQLTLTTGPNQIDTVAQELYRVVSFENGFVQSSQVTQTGGLDGTATFQLSFPSSRLSDAMGKLSQLPNSHVAARTDSTQDVTNQYNDLNGRLASARALRTALLRQLAAAVTTQQIDSLKAQLGDVNAQIATYLGQLAGLGHQINYSQVSVQINAAQTPVPPHHSSGGLTPGKALHTAGKVLTVAAAIALIGLAGLLPVALVVALIWWIWATLRRRRREHALDLA